MDYFYSKPFVHRNFAVETKQLEFCFNINRVQFAKMLEITPRLVRRLELGIINPSNDIIRKYNSLLFFSHIIDVCKNVNTTLDCYDKLIDILLEPVYSWSRYLLAKLTRKIDKQGQYRLL